MKGLMLALVAVIGMAYDGCTLNEPATKALTAADCTLERLQELDPEGYVRAQPRMVRSQREIDDAKAAAAKAEADALALPEPPKILGLSPEVEKERLFWQYTIVPHLELGGCRAKTDEKLVEVWLRGATWNYFVAHASEAWNRHVAERAKNLASRNIEDARSAHVVRQAFFASPNLEKNIEDAKIFSRRLVTLIAENAEVTKWAVGLAGTLLSEESRRYMEARIRSAWRATHTDFVDLDKKVRTAEAELKQRRASAESDEVRYSISLPPALDFSPSYEENQNGDYMTGILLRRWREHEARGRGKGNAWVKEAQTALKNLAVGLKISL